jgi:hypothetical protein
LGSSTDISVTENSPLAFALQNDYEFKNNTRQVATAGGLVTIQEQVGVASNLKL